MKNTILYKYNFSTILLLALNLFTCLDTQGETKIELKFDKGTYLRGESIVSFCTIYNNSDKTIEIKLPDYSKLTFLVKGSVADSFKVQFQKNELFSNEVVFLKAKQSLQVKLGEISIKYAKNDKLQLPTGNYVLILKNFLLMNQAYEASEAFAINEYPLSVNITAPASFSAKDSVMLKICITNNGPYKIKLFNLFSPYKDFFDLVMDKKQLLPQVDKKEELPADPYLKKVTTLPQDESWLTLMPGESTSIDVNISDQIKTGGIFNLRMTYTRKILLCPPKEKPKYSDQYQWYSNPIKIEVHK